MSEQAYQPPRKYKITAFYEDGRIKEIEVSGTLHEAVRELSSSAGAVCVGLDVKEIREAILGGETLDK